MKAQPKNKQHASLRFKLIPRNETIEWQVIPCSGGAKETLKPIQLHSGNLQSYRRECIEVLSAFKNAIKGARSERVDWKAISHACSEFLDNTRVLIFQVFGQKDLS